MARATTSKLYRTFVKGLITEAGPLTYPEDASIAEDNCIIYRTGNRSRRLGFDLESQNAGSPPISDADLQTIAIQQYTWNSVGNNPDINIGVVQLGTMLYFYNLNVEPIIFPGMGFNYDMTAMAVSGATNIDECPVDIISGRGILFVAGEKYEPFIIQYNETLNTIIVSQVYIQIRDFKGLQDGLANDEEPTTLSGPHHYNLRNQGWVDSENNGAGTSVTYFDQFGTQSTYPAPASTPITTYQAAVGRYPGNNKQWHIARDSTTGAFDPALLQKLYAGTGLAPRGHYVVNAFNIDRSAVSGVSSIAVESTSSRPNSVTFANGRAWWGHNNSLYFSQVLTDKAKAGFCYQEADPTSEDISDLVPTDGGVIPIPEMSKVVRLIPSGSGIVAFADNGVWYVGGTQAGFSASDFSVSKISPIGTDSPDSILEVEGSIYWWSRIGVMAMAQKQGLFGTVEGIFEKTNIAETTIQTFFNGIPKATRKYVKGVYDPLTNVIQWMYSSDESNGRYVYDRFLILDLTLQAFYPWSTTITSTMPKFVGLWTTPLPAGYQGPLETSVRNTYIKYLVVYPLTTPGTWTLSCAQAKDINFVDWADWATAKGIDSQTYLSYVETGYQLLEDAIRKKQTPWIATFFKRTEENYVLDGLDYTPDRQSSCLFQVKWDWSSSNVSNKYSTKREAYRHVRVPAMSSSSLEFDTGFPIVVTKHKVRGSGKSIQFRFESEARGKDFDLLGWQVIITGNTDA